MIGVVTPRSPKHRGHAFARRDHVVHKLQYSVLIWITNRLIASEFERHVVRVLLVHRVIREHQRQPP